MGLFTSKEQKEQERLMKEQAKANEKLAKMRQKMADRGLESLDEEYYGACIDIFSELSGTGMMETGAILTGMKTEEQLKVTYLNTLIQQNWIIIRELDRITKALEK